MQTVSSIIKKLMLQDQYYGYFACTLNKEFSDKLDTAGVCQDGIDYKLLINKKWWDTLEPDIRLGVIHHEILHLCFFHCVDTETWRSLCPDSTLLNIAMDCEVQSYLKPETRWSECTTEKIFAECPNLPRGLGTKEYVKAIKALIDPKSNTFNQAVADLMDELSKDKSHSLWGDSSGAKGELAKNQLEYQMKEAAKETLKSRGTLPSELKEKLEGLLKPAPPVFNWKGYFRRLLGTSFDIYKKKTRRKESERFEDSPGLKRKKKHNILVAIDTSGSVNQKELMEFFSEIKHIWKAGAKIDILECDTKISKPKYEYTGTVPEFISGRGGTSFLEPIAYFNDHRNEYTTMVYFTDGYGDQNMCKPLGKMLWVITSDGYQESEFPGIKICIPKNKKV